MNTTKTIATIVDVQNFVSPKQKDFVLITVDTDVPGFVSDGHFITKGLVRQFAIEGSWLRESFIGGKIEITTSFHNAGENYNGKALEHDCYIRTIENLK